jgi:predicted RNase H-like HicB family nuclease
MTTDVLPDILAPAVADSVRRLAAEPANGTFEARNLTLLARHFEYILQESRAVEAEVKALVNEGVEAGLLRRRCESALESIEQALDAATGILQLGARVPPTKQSVSVVERSTETVEKVRQELQEIRAVYLGYMEVLNRPLSPIDWKALEEESRAGREAGTYVRYETPEELLRDFGGQ